MQVKTSGQRLRETHVSIESYGPSDSYSPQINIRPAGRTIAAAQGLLIRPQCNCWSEGTGGLKFLRDQLEELNGYPIFGNKIGLSLCHKEPAQGTQSPLLGALGRNAPY